MQIKLNNLKDTIKPYPMDYLNCFEHPIAVTCKYLKPGSDYLYILYMKLFQTFSYDYTVVSTKNYKEEIGIKCNTIEISNNLVLEIENLINKGYPVLVPGNHKALFYTQKYMREDWGHLFLIKGFDKERKLFYLLDNLHIVNQDEVVSYTEFPIRYEDLESVFDAYNVFGERHIFYYELDDERSDIDKLIAFLNKLNNALLKGNSIEEYIIQYVTKEENDGNFEYEEIQMAALLNTSKNKIVLLEQLISYLEEYQYDLHGMNSLKEQLQKTWTVDSLRIVKNLKTGFFKNISNIKSENTRKLEDKLLQEIKNCIIYLEGIRDDIQYKNKKLNCENNQDGIITLEDNKYTFYFQNSKTYNTWLSDECPKVIMYNSYQGCSDFNFEARCEEIEKDSSIGHVSGIYIRTVENKMYTFGINHEGEYIFDLIGKYMIGSYTKVYEGSTSCFYMKRQEGLLSIGIRKDNCEEYEYKRIPMNEKVIQIGMFCKTWDNCKHLKVVFDKWKLDYID